jgi:hypothetical protein
MMTDEISGFALEPSSSNRHLFRRATEPRHEYNFEITSKHVVLRATLPNDVGVDRRDALDDAERSEKEARKAAEELHRRIYSCHSASASRDSPCGHSVPSIFKSPKQPAFAQLGAAAVGRLFHGIVGMVRPRGASPGIKGEISQENARL